MSSICGAEVSSPAVDSRESNEDQSDVVFWGSQHLQFIFPSSQKPLQGKKWLLAFNLTNISKEKKALAMEGCIIVNLVEILAKFQLSIYYYDILEMLASQKILDQD